MQVSAILDNIDRGGLSLPMFQRGYVWTRPQVKKLMHSLCARPTLKARCISLLAIQPMKRQGQRSKLSLQPIHIYAQCLGKGGGMLGHWGVAVHLQDVRAPVSRSEPKTSDYSSKGRLVVTRMEPRSQRWLKTLKRSSAPWGTGVRSPVRR